MIPKSDLSKDGLTASKVNLWGSQNNAHQGKELGKESFTQQLEESSYYEVTEAHLGSSDLDFTIQINGESFKGHSLLSKEYLKNDRILRKPQAKDFKQVSFTKKGNASSFNFKLKPIENKAINTLFERVIKSLDSDGDIEEGALTRPPKNPNSNSDHSSAPEANRKAARELHLSFSTSA